MFDCMLRYLTEQWWWLPIFVIVFMVVGFFAGGWWGVLIGFGFGVAVGVLNAFWNCSR